jgi:hypothetical protein
VLRDASLPHDVSQKAVSFEDQKKKINCKEKWRREIDRDRLIL